MHHAAHQLRQPPGAPAGGQFASTQRPGAGFTLGEWGDETFSFEDYLASIHDPDAPYLEDAAATRPTPAGDALLDDEAIAAGVELGLVEPVPETGRRAA